MKKIIIHNHLRARDALSNGEFLSLAEAVGTALQNNRAEEDRLRAAGRGDEANRIYARNKEEARRIFQQSGLSAQEFDKRLASLGGGRRINVKLTRLGF